MDKKYIDKFVDEKYFDLPKSYLKSLFVARKFHYIRTPIEILNPALIICNKTSEYDQFLIRTTITTDYVVLKESYVRQIYANTLSASDKKELLKNMEMD